MRFYCFLVATLAFRLRGQHGGLSTHGGECFRGGTSTGPRPTGPGAGMTPEDIEPHVNALKDGYYHVGCYQDQMDRAGDKFGDMRMNYEGGAMTAHGEVSIVRYQDHLDHDARELMTQRTCFNFCRSVPDMLFFGLTRGRECYCMPYYVTGPGHGTCDRPCEGDNTQTCGGKTKTSVFEMHLCADTSNKLTDLAQQARTLLQMITGTGDESILVAAAMEKTANALMAHSIEVTDMLSHANGQAAKVISGAVRHSAERAHYAAEELRKCLKTIRGMTGYDFSIAANAYAAEDAITATYAAMETAQYTMMESEQTANAIHPAYTAADVNNSAAMFEGALFRFDETKNENRQNSFVTVCEGKYSGSTMGNLTYEGCAEACNSAAPKSDIDYCIGFQFYDMGVQPGGTLLTLCHLYREIGKVEYYHCPDERKSTAALISTHVSNPQSDFTRVQCSVRGDVNLHNTDLEARPKCWGLDMTP